MGIYCLIACSASDSIGFNGTALYDHRYKKETGYNPQGQTDWEINLRGNQLACFLNYLQGILGSA